MSRKKTDLARVMVSLSSRKELYYSLDEIQTSLGEFVRCCNGKRINQGEKRPLRPFLTDWSSVNDASMKNRQSKTLRSMINLSTGGGLLTELVTTAIEIMLNDNLDPMNGD